MEYKDILDVTPVRYGIYAGTFPVSFIWNHSLPKIKLHSEEFSPFYGYNVCVFLHAVLLWIAEIWRNNLSKADDGSFLQFLGNLWLHWYPSILVVVLVSLSFKFLQRCNEEIQPFLSKIFTVLMSKEI